MTVDRTKLEDFHMLKQKEPVVFEPKNLESLIQGLDKKDLESLIKIIKYKKAGLF